MATDRQIIQGLWIGSELSVMEQLSIASFLRSGHEYHLYVYGEMKNVPRGCVIRDASEILPAERIFQYPQYPSYAGFANFFRYKLLLERGGWWADTDVICLQPKLVWGETGPRLVAEAVKKFSLEEYRQPADVFCPLGYADWRQVIEPETHLRFNESTRAIHLWNEMWRDSGQDKNAAYDLRCLYEQLKKKYLEHPQITQIGS